MDNCSFHGSVSAWLPTQHECENTTSRNRWDITNPQHTCQSRGQGLGGFKTGAMQSGDTTAACTTPACRSCYTSHSHSLSCSTGNDKFNGSALFPTKRLLPARRMVLRPLSTALRVATALNHSPSPACNSSSTIPSCLSMPDSTCPKTLTTIRPQPTSLEARSLPAALIGMQ